MKEQKVKEKKYKAPRQESIERLTANFSIAIMETKRQRNEIFNVLKINNCQTKLLYSAKISFIIE